ncbi:unnamed protein product, partial [Prorocentrum cordatum]
ETAAGVSQPALPPRRGPAAGAGAAEARVGLRVLRRRGAAGDVRATGPRESRRRRPRPAVPGRLLRRRHGPRGAAGARPGARGRGALPRRGPPAGHRRRGPPAAGAGPGAAGDAPTRARAAPLRPADPGGRGLGGPPLGAPRPLRRVAALRGPRSGAAPLAPAVT